MHPFFQNKFVRFVGIGIAVLITLPIVFIMITNLFTQSTGLSSNEIGYAPSFNNSNSPSMGKAVTSEMDMTQSDSYYYPPQPSPDDYTSDLELYETSQYSINARTRQFDELCSTLTNLKADPEIQFKLLTTSTNNCRATFYTDEEKVTDVLSTLTAFSGVEVDRTTKSVTRHRQQIQTQTSILQQQLASVERSLTAAETQFDEIAEFARANKDAATLSQTISQKLNNIDMLTQRKINLTSQLNSLYQQAADLEERLGIVQFDININRSYPIYPEQNLQKWEQAWEELKDAYTDTLIGISAFFGIFLLWTIRLTIYLLVLIIILRGVWKFIQLIWKKW